MAVNRISVNCDAKIWTSSVYTKNLTPFELYYWMISRFNLDDDRLLSIIVQREQQRRSYPLKRSQSLPVDLNEAARERPFWHTVRVMYRYGGENDEAVSAEKVFRRIMSNSSLDNALSIIESMSPYEATLSGAIPERRVRRGGCKKLNKSEKTSLMEVIAAEARATRKESECNEEFQAYIAEVGINNLSVKIMRQFALKHLIVGGHWTIYAEANPKTTAAANGRSAVNRPQVAVWQTWKELLKGFLFGPLAASRATALSFKRTMDGRSISVSNPRCISIQKEMTEEDPLDGEVLSVDKAIRSCGYKGRMKYKPDVFSVCQITHSNQHVLRPTIYLSEVNETTGERITTDYTKDYTPEVRMGNHSAYRRQEQNGVVESNGAIASPSIRSRLTHSSSSISQLCDSPRVSPSSSQFRRSESVASSSTASLGMGGVGRGGGLVAPKRVAASSVWASGPKPG